MVIKREQASKINSSVFILICIWFCMPKVQVVTGKTFLFLLLISWIVTADWNCLFKSISWNKWFLVWYIYMLLLLILGVWEYGLSGASSFFIDVPLFFLGALIFSYYKAIDNNILLGKGCMVSLFCILIGSLNSIFKLLQYPMASRILATGSMESKEYAQMGIGGYSYVYASVMIMVSVIYLLKTKKSVSIRYKTFLLILYIVNFIFIIKASYTIAIIFAIFLSAISLISFKNLKWLMLIGVISSVLIIIFRAQVGYFLIIIANNLPQGLASYGKILDFAQGLTSNNFGSETINRLDLYMKSVNCFFNSPLFGRIWSNNTEYAIGNHSTWFDLLGAFGLIGSLPIFIFIILKFKNMIKLWNHNDYGNYIVIILLYVSIFGFINPIISAYEFGFILFLLVPSFPYIIYANEQKEDKVEENEHL